MVRNFIDKVKGYGAKIAIDYFGSGYSNFMYLIQLNVDFAKIMNAKTIGEFVENKDVFESAVELGVDFSQGYYFSPPVNKPEGYFFSSSGT